MKKDQEPRPRQQSQEELERRAAEIANGLEPKASSEFRDRVNGVIPRSDGPEAQDKYLKQLAEIVDENERQ